MVLAPPLVKPPPSSIHVYYNYYQTTPDVNCLRHLASRFIIGVYENVIETTKLIQSLIVSVYFAPLNMYG